MAEYDFIVVGGGSAGCVMAARLTENPACRVLLLEAGDDIVPGAEPADIASPQGQSSFNKNYRWPLSGASQARVLGGGASIMGMVALRGLPADYDGWAAAGADGWGWADVLPWFVKLETDIDFDNAQHGQHGPTTLRRNPTSAWPPLCVAMHAHARNHGATFIDDMNGDFREGFGVLPMSATSRMRQSSAICYLTREVRRRANLTVRTRAQVVALHHRDGRFDGVSAQGHDGTVQDFSACEIILCAGALLSPALLLRAGIGPPADLIRLGIPVLAERSGVGGNLQNHPMLFLAALLPRAARQKDAASAINCCMRYSSGGDVAQDLYFAVFNRTGTHPLGRRVATLQSYLLQPASRGRVSLASADPQAPPRIDFNFFSEEADVTRCAVGVRDMARLATSPEFAIAGGRFFAVRFSDRLRRLNENNAVNRCLSGLAAAALDWLPGSACLIRRAMGRGPDAKMLLDSHTDLRDHVRRYVSPSGHHAGTCRMGPASDPAAVVDANGRVHGVSGLRVADASIMPTLPRGNTNIPTLMLAEKLSAGVLADFESTP